MINMEIAQEILKSFGMEPEEAWNGKEAVELFEGKPAGVGRGNEQRYDLSPKH